MKVNLPMDLLFPNGLVAVLKQWITLKCCAVTEQEKVRLCVFGLLITSHIILANPFHYVLLVIFWSYPSHHILLIISCS